MSDIKKIIISYISKTYTDFFAYTHTPIRKHIFTNMYHAHIKHAHSHVYKHKNTHTYLSSPNYSAIKL